jgi:cysteine desulfurase
MRIYLDNNATTIIHPEVRDVMSRDLEAVFGNPSSIHEEGQRARRALEEAREELALLIGAKPREIVFTSGGTESDNAAVFGIASLRPGSHVVSSSIEHPAVLEAVRELERRGHPVSWVGCDSDGRVDAAGMIDALRPETSLVTLMLGNNETGVIQPVEEVGRACRQQGIHLHCDAVQAGGKLPVEVEQLQVDTLALSGHKMHAPKGIGLLYLRSGTTLQPMLFGGAQERRRRAGTENVPLASAFAQAGRLYRRELELVRQMAARRDRFEQRVLELLPETRINGRGAARLANTSNLRFPGVDGEALVIALDLAGVAVSSGSACASGRVEPSHVLLAMGLSVEDARSSVRFSLNRFHSDAEIEQVAALLERLVPRHRR